MKTVAFDTLHQKCFIALFVILCATHSWLLKFTFYPLVVILYLIIMLDPSNFVSLYLFQNFNLVHKKPLFIETPRDIENGVSILSLRIGERSVHIPKIYFSVRLSLLQRLKELFNFFMGGRNCPCLRDCEAMFIDTFNYIKSG